MSSVSPRSWWSTHNNLLGWPPITNNKTKSWICHRILLHASNVTTCLPSSWRLIASKLSSNIYDSLVTLKHVWWISFLSGGVRYHFTSLNKIKSRLKLSQEWFNCYNNWYMTQNVRREYLHQIHFSCNEECKQYLKSCPCV